MRITSLTAFFIAILGGVDTLIKGLFNFSLSAFIFVEGSFLQRLFFCLVGVATVFFVFFVKTFRPFKTLCK
jgi:uncharacterized membrane protein YuzA (DUF378 family)